MHIFLQMFYKKIEKLKVRYEEMLECDNDDCFIKRSIKNLNYYLQTNRINV